jgi:transposase
MAGRRDWRVARTMWSRGHSKSEIAACFELSVKAFRTRVQKWRRNPATANWFPQRP